MRCDEQILIPDIVLVDAASPNLTKPLLTNEDVHCAAEPVPLEFDPAVLRPL